ncbi:amidase [Staphylospora marina]|uniref:amidase n=1 Tax=Staphylospora marina TaxID=2490858 RepID=UPI001F150326|nr:amidase [Staphylospora marina]
MTEILDMDASGLAESIRLGHISPREATEAYMARIRRVNPNINAVVETRFEEALREADSPPGQKNGRLRGVPVSIKESFDVKGMLTTGGIPGLGRTPAPADSEPVRRLREEGAIVLCKTNTPALCFCQETDNVLYGRTNNPWDLTRTAGGSSGGEGALIAAGGAAVGLGSDIGGSIRFPAHFNGVIGFKSAADSVPDSGSHPVSPWPLQRIMLGHGAMAKSVRDARLIHEIITDRHIATVPDDSVRVSVPEPLPDLPMGQETADLLQAIRRSLQRNRTVDAEGAPHLKESALTWQLIMSLGGAEHIRKTAGLRGILHTTTEWLKGKAGLHTPWHPWLTWGLLGAWMFRPNDQQVAELERWLARSRKEVEAYLRGRVVILPVWHTAAPEHGTVYGEIFSIRKTFLKYMPYVAWVNTFGLPSLTVPVGEDRDGLPIGVQLVTAPGQEDVLFRLGEELERDFRGYVRCRLEDQPA